jgi:hypothetical protein
VLEKEAVSANQVRDHYDQGGAHTQLKRSVTDRAATAMDALVSTMQDVGLTKGNAKYKKEISKTEKGRLVAEVRLGQTGGGSEI